MIESRQKNQNCVDRAIKNFMDENDHVSERDLMKFTKYLVAQLLIRTEAHDCYIIDMLEDIDRMELK